MQKVCCLPKVSGIYAFRRASDEACVVMTVDEYETIRLIDKENFSQEECGKYMHIARTTVQQIYDSARKKLAEVVVDGKMLRIEGGDYRLCDGAETTCGCGGCPKHRCRAQVLNKDKGIIKMKIAVTYDNGEIFQHFGHTEQFKLYDIENGKVVASEVVGTNGSGHGALAGFLAEQQVQVLICGGIGGGAQNALAQAGIKLFGGCSGNADQAVEALLEGQLNYDADVKCSHHDHEHGEGGHQCGNHGCGSHSCH